MIFSTYLLLNTIRITIFSDAETVPFGKLLENSVKRNKVGKIKPIPKAYKLVNQTSEAQMDALVAELCAE